MNKYNTEFEYKQLSTKEIVVDEKGQRNVNNRNAQFRKIMREFNPLLVNDIKVALIDGKYYCFDGQMTMKVLKARNGGKDLMVNCKVYYGKTKLDAANLFVKQNGTVSQVIAHDKLRVLYNYGDENVVNFVRLTEMNRVIVEWNGTGGKNKVAAVSTLYKIFNDFNDPCEYSTFLKVLCEAWGGERDSFRNEIMSGLHLFMKTYKGQYNPKVLIRKLKDVSPKTIIREARVSTATGARKYALQFYNAYNKNSSKNRLPDLL